MKILVMSLLRLGDIILHSELIASMKEKYPKAEIHFLINSQFSFTSSLFPQVQKWHYLDRKKIQKILIEQNQSPQAAFETLNAVVEKINVEQFDVIINATHNLLSVRLMDLFEAKEKKGAALINGKKSPIQNNWLQYLNENFVENKGSRFHYVEILHRAFDLPINCIQSQSRRSTGPILLQVLTSDVKKNWGIQKFAQLKRAILVTNPGEKIFAICSPSEKPEVQKYFSEDEILSTSLDQAQELLESAKLLITGDTSIQHLAAKCSCPIIALHLGSADPVKTSAWLLGSQVIQGQAPCRPCRHSEKCSQSSHLCGDNLKVEVVASRTFQFLQNKLNAQLVRNGEHFFFQDETGDNSFQKLEQLVWGFYLNNQTSGDLFILPDIGKIPPDAKYSYQRLQIELEKLELKIERISASVFNPNSSGETRSLALEIKHQVQVLKLSFPEISDSFFSLEQSFAVNEASFFEFLKRLRAGFRQAQALNDIRERLISIELRKPTHPDRLSRDQEASFE